MANYWKKCQQQVCQSHHAFKYCHPIDISGTIGQLVRAERLCSPFGTEVGLGILSAYWLKSGENCFYSYFDSNSSVRPQCCACHDNSAIVTSGMYKLVIWSDQQLSRKSNMILQDSDRELIYLSCICPSTCSPEVSASSADATELFDERAGFFDTRSSRYLATCDHCPPCLDIYVAQGTGSRLKTTSIEGFFLLFTIDMPFLSSSACALIPQITWSTPFEMQK